MKKILKYIFILELIKIIYSIVPLWDFEKSTVNLLNNSQNSDTYTVCDKTINSLQFKLIRIIKKEGNTINQNRNLYLDNGKYTIYNVPWEDVGNIYKVKDNYNNYKYYICPKGKFHLHVYDGQNLVENYPEGFYENGDWELKCYYLQLENLNILYIGYLNTEQHFYHFDLNKEEYAYNYQIFDGLYDFRWTFTDDKPQLFPLLTLNKKNNEGFFLQFDYIWVNYDRDSDFTPSGNPRKLIDIKSKTISYFDENEESFNFYFLTYDNYFDFKIGYYKGGEIITESNLKKIKIIIHNETPLEFLDNINIEKINFIPYTKYLYYTIYNNKNNVKYHGIIDVEYNKLIFNTDKDILEFKPYSNNSMLAITKDSAYKICAVRDGDNCINECSNGFVPVYDTKSNVCKSKKECDNITLIPDDICLENCDTNIFTLKGKECGLCKDIYQTTTPKKLMNTSNCIDSIPENAEYYNEDLELLTCKNEYFIFQDKCVMNNCYEECSFCSKYSTDENDQNCYECKNKEYFMQEGNCVPKCEDGYYHKNEEKKICYKCHEHCATCLNGGTDENENCLSCDNNNTNYKYLVDAEGFYKNCVGKCPEKTKLVNNKCILEEKKEDNKSDDNNNNDNKNDNNNNDDYFLYIYIIFIFLLILIIIICFYRTICCRKKDDRDLINEISTELMENK